MNWADWLIIALILISTVISLARGFVKEALSLATWVIAFIVARMFSDNLAQLLSQWVETSSIQMALAFAGLFAATLIVGALINRLISEVVRVTGLTGTDRVLGTFFGFIRGVVLMVVVVALLRFTPFEQDNWWRQSTLIPHLQVVESWTRHWLKDNHNS